MMYKYANSWNCPAVTRVFMNVIGNNTRGNLIMRYIAFALIMLLASACRLAPLSEIEKEEPLAAQTQQPTLVLTPTVTLPPANTGTPTPTTRPTISTSSGGTTTNPPACTPRADWTATYTIQSGDTLNKIAQRAGTTIDALQNGNCLADANVISVGQVLRVPAILPPVSPTSVSTPSQICRATLNVTTSLFLLPNSSDITQAIQLAAGDNYFVSGQFNGWYRLPIPSMNKEYWIDGARVTLSGNCSGIPFIQVSNPGGTDPNKCYFMSYGIGGGPHPAYMSADPNDKASTDAMIMPETYYQVIGISDIRYQILFSDGGKQWVDRIFGSLNGNCSAIMQTQTGNRTFTYDTLVKLAFDHPASWYYGVNLDGLPGGYVSTFLPQDMPPTASAWTSNMVMVSFTVFPPGLVPNGLEMKAHEEKNGFLNSGRYSLVQDVTPVTLNNGISGWMFQVSGPQGIGKMYYLNVNGSNVLFMLAGNYDLAAPILNSLRPM
jgi:LysM repeat protein